VTHRKPRGTTKVGGLAPAFIALLFVALAVGLIVLYRGRDGSPPQPSPPSPAGEATDLGLAPAFSLPAVDGSIVSLEEFRGRKNVLLFVNEGVM